MTKQSERIIS